MKRLFIIGLILTTFQINAQEKFREHHREQTRRIQDLTPEQTAIIKTKKMTLDLNLTDGQQKKIYDLNLQHATEIKSKKEARKQNKEDGVSKKELSSDERFELMNAKLDKQIEYKKQLQEILNSDQLEKWENLKSRPKQKIRKKSVKKHKLD